MIEDERRVHAEGEFDTLLGEELGSAKSKLESRQLHRPGGLPHYLLKPASGLSNFVQEDGQDGS